MGIEEGFSRYACDRSDKAHASGKKAVSWLRQDDKERGRWATVEHTDDLGVTTRLTLCPECLEKYRSVKETWNRDFREFAEEGY